MRDQKSSRASPIYKSQVINRSHQWMSPCKIIGGQSHKPSMTVNYDSTVVKYDCRVRYKFCQERCKKSMKSRTSHFNYKAFSGFIFKDIIGSYCLTNWVNRTLRPLELEALGLPTAPQQSKSKNCFRCNNFFPIAFGIRFGNLSRLFGRLFKD